MDEVHRFDIKNMYTRPLMNHESVRLIDGGYGDSDVYLVDRGDASSVCKMYQPERMNGYLQLYLRHGSVEELVGYEFLKPHLKNLRGITTARIRQLLPRILEQYSSDTAKIAGDIMLKPDTYRYAVENDPQLESVRFEVLPQGLMHMEQGECVSVEGQRSITDANLEQILGVTFAEARTIKGHLSEPTHYPDAFRTRTFVDAMLVKFNQDLMRAIITEQLRSFPIYNRIHPANVIPTQDEPKHWRFIVTDLAMTLCLDYALLLNHLDQNAAPQRTRRPPRSGQRRRRE